MRLEAEELPLFPRFMKHFTQTQMCKSCRLWNAADLKHHRTVSNGSSWITDGMYLPGSKKLVFTALDRSVSIRFLINTSQPCPEVFLRTECTWPGSKKLVFTALNHSVRPSNPTEPDLRSSMVLYARPASPHFSEKTLLMARS